MRRSHEKIQHKVGEVILGELGNFVEDPSTDRKMRPLVVLNEGLCQHEVAGLTTQEFFKTTGKRRTAVPNPSACGLNQPGFLWSHKPAKISRIDVRQHLGWVDHAMVDTIERTMRVTPMMLLKLRQAAVAHHRQTVRT